MNDPNYSWPSWKFGMKRDDLFTTLQDQYNTVSSSIQDPEAFHHDVFEITNEARTLDEFHRLMTHRRQQRLRELNGSLESAAVEIIANPKLVGTEQWSFALQLFRTRSLDSLVRYFSSYLPEGYLDHDHFHDASSVASTNDDRCSVHSESTDPSSVGDVDGPSLFDDRDEKPSRKRHTLRVDTSSKNGGVGYDVPLSPHSFTSHADTSVSSPSASETQNGDYPSPTRSMSFSGSESDRFGRDARHLIDEDQGSQTGIDDTLAISISEIADTLATRSVAEETHSSLVELAEHVFEDDFGEDYFEATQLPDDLFDPVMDSVETETPTPKPAPTAEATAYIDCQPLPSSKPLLHPRLSTEGSPNCKTNRHCARRSGSPAMGIRRSPEEAFSRISKPLPDPIRTRKGHLDQGRRRGLD